MCFVRANDVSSSSHVDLTRNQENTSYTAEATASLVSLRSAFSTTLLPLHSSTPENHWQRNAVQGNCSQFPQLSVQPKMLRHQIFSPHTEPHMSLDPSLSSWRGRNGFARTLFQPSGKQIILGASPRRWEVSQFPPVTRHFPAQRGSSPSGRRGGSQCWP